MEIAEAAVVMTGRQNTLEPPEAPRPRPLKVERRISIVVAAGADRRAEDQPPLTGRLRAVRLLIAL